MSYRYWTKIHWATPPWLSDDDMDAIGEKYEACEQGEVVDHIVPLENPLVCGLHVPWNLRVIPYALNAQKSNHYWPDCPNHLCPILNATLDLFDDDPKKL